MDLLSNPFYVLTATSRDNRQRIIELADERSFDDSGKKCSQACSNLTHPRRRLSAEIAWLPGSSPKCAGEMLMLLEASALGRLEQRLSASLDRDELTPIARANLLAATLYRLPKYSPDHVARLILEIAKSFERAAIDPQKLCAVINEERRVSGFCAVTDLSAVKEEIQNQRRHYRQVISSVLDNLSTKECMKAVTVAVESATDNGGKHGPTLIDALVERYELRIKDVIEEQEGNIKLLIEEIRASADAKCPNSTLSPMVSKLIQAVKAWDLAAQPIQVSTKSRGLPHEASHDVARIVRELVVHLFNKHDELDFSRQLNRMLQEVFVEVPEIFGPQAEDGKKLDAIAEQRQNTEPPSNVIPDDANATQKEQSDRVVSAVVFLVAVVLMSVFWNANKGGQSARKPSPNLPIPSRSDNPLTTQPSSSRQEGMAKSRPLNPSVSNESGDSGKVLRETFVEKSAREATKGAGKEHGGQSTGDGGILSYNFRQSNPTSATTYSDSADADQSAGLQYEKPFPGINNMFSLSQTRWCLREKIRLEAVRNALSDAKEEADASARGRRTEKESTYIAVREKVDRLSRITKDVSRISSNHKKSRCRDRSLYHPDLEQQARREVEANRSQIVSEAVSSYAGR